MGTHLAKHVPTLLDIAGQDGSPAHMRMFSYRIKKQSPLVPVGSNWFMPIPSRAADHIRGDHAAMLFRLAAVTGTGRAALDYSSLVEQLCVLLCVDNVGMVQRQLLAAKQNVIDALDAKHQAVVLVGDLVLRTPEAAQQGEGCAMRATKYFLISHARALLVHALLAIVGRAPVASK
eukprot:366199-Chlamydomonas_euryale.AAC.15